MVMKPSVFQRTAAAVAKRFGVSAKALVVVNFAPDGAHPLGAFFRS